MARTDAAKIRIIIEITKFSARKISQKWIFMFNSIKTSCKTMFCLQNKKEEMVSGYSDSFVSSRHRIKRKRNGMQKFSPTWGKIIFIWYWTAYNCHLNLFFHQNWNSKSHFSTLRNFSSCSALWAFSLFTHSAILGEELFITIVSFTCTISL